MTCELCSGTGQVIVPSPRYVKNGCWQSYGSTKLTTSVLCSCGAADKIIEAQATKHPHDRQMKLVEYEKHLSRDVWRSMLALDEEERRLKAAEANKGKSPKQLEREDRIRAAGKEKVDVEW